MAAEPEGSERLAYLLGTMALRDRAAFKALYELTRRFLFSVALRRVGTAERAEDVLQEAYLEAWQKAGSYSSATARPMTWLMTIVNARAIDAHRRLVREGAIVVAVDDPDAELEDQASLEIRSESFRDHFGADVTGRLVRCFEELSADQRRAIVSIRIRGFTIDEAAAAFKVPRQTAAAWVRRGIQRLAECLGKL